MACRAKPSSSGSVTATTCMTPLSISRWTRCRTAASDRPTTLPMAAYERRPSCWSCSMIALETSSRGMPRRSGFLFMGACCHSAPCPGKGLSRHVRQRISLPYGLSIDGFACQRPPSHGTIRAIERGSRRTRMVGASGPVASRLDPPERPAGRGSCRVRGSAAWRRSSCPFFGVDRRKVESGACIGDGPLGHREEADHLQLAGLHRPHGRRRPPRSRCSRTRTGITVNYTDDVNDNDEFYAKVQNQLGVVRADQPRHDRADRLDGRPDDRARLDPAARHRPRCPNLHANLIEPLRKPPVGPRPRVTTRRGRAA